jgi:hypothetical protein
MFRENVPAKPEIAGRIAATMVPVAVDFRTFQDPRSEESRFLTPLVKQRDQDQGVWIFSPEGKALGGFVGFGDMAAQTRKVIDDALAAHGDVAARTVEPAEMHPHRGRGRTPEGGACLAQYVRRWGNTLFSHGSSPVISSVALSAAELRELAPPKVVVGTRWTVPEAVTRRFCRLSSPLCFQHAPQPDGVTAASIEGRVASIDGAGARLVYTGRIASTHRGISEQEVRLEGEGSCDVNGAALRSLLIVGSGSLVWKEAPDKPATFDALAEWTLGAP